MTLVGHLRELRNRVAVALLFILLGTAVSFWWYENGLGDFLRAPYCGLPADLRFDGNGDQNCELLITDVFGGVFIRIKVSFLAGVVLSAPFWLYQVWAFITPGLKRNEKKYGVAIALTAQDYIGFVISLLIAFGVSFELPLIAVVLNLIGVLSYEALSKGRRWIFFLTIVFAAFVTPTQDPFTMLLMAGPMIVLFELAIQAARFVDRRRAKREAALGLSGLADDEASPLVEGPSRLDEPSPLDEPTTAPR